MASMRTIELDDQTLVVSRQPDGSLCIETDVAQPIRMHRDEAAALVAALKWELLLEPASSSSA